jgi:hypothetical protein
MRALALAAALALIGAAAAAAPQAPTPPAAPLPPPVPPRIFLAAGYSEPDITPGFCHNIDVSHTQCTIPAMTAGRYVVAASGASTATAADAVQEIIIGVGAQPCNTSTRAPDPKNPWAVGTRRTFVAACIVTIVTDAPLTVTAVYADAKATKDPKGPLLSVSREPWPGFISTQPASVNQQ